MKYGSVCSGIEAASVAWHPLGWEPQWFSEIESFPSEVLKQRFPDIPNLGDMTKLTLTPTFNEKSIDLLVGGTPCQSFSVAGLRGGLADPRGNLMLTFLGLADAKKPKWIVWENVPGVLSSNGGKDFGTFLGALGELGYGFAYRVLDAQYFGVAQRRRRVFVVGYLGDWRVAAAVLFERESLQGNTKPSRKKREEVTTDAQGSVGATVFAGNQQSEIAATLQTTCDDYSRADGFNVIIDRAAFNQGENAQYEPRIETGETMSSLVAKGPHAVAQPIGINGNIAGTIDANYFKGCGSANFGERDVVAQPIAVTITFNDANGTRADRPNGGLYVTEEPRCTSALTCGDNDTKVMQPIAVDTYNYTTNDHTTQTIRSQSDTEHIGAVLQSMAFPINTENMFEGSTSYGRTVGENNEPSFALTKAHSHAVGTNMAIRRLTPKECERLQGFPDDWTKIPYRNKEADQCPDAPRYKACGNSMAVPVMRWIGERIEKIEKMLV